MVDFSTQLPTVSSGKPIINPGPAPQSGIADAASVFGGLLTGMKQGEQLRAERQRMSMDTIKFGQEQEDRSANNELATKLQGVFDNGPLASLPTDVQSQVGSLQNLQRGVANGKIPAEAYELAMRKAVSDTMANHPQAASTILSTFHGLGLQNFETADADNARKIADSQQDDQIKAESTAYDAAAKNGLISPTMSRSEILMAGRTSLKNDADRQHAIQTQELLKTNQGMSHEESTWADAQTQKQVFTTLSSDLDNYAGTFFQNAINHASAAIKLGKSGDILDLLNTSQTLGSQLKIAWRHKATELGITDQNYLDGLDKKVDGFTASLQGIMNGNVDNNLKAMQLVQTQFKMDTAHALPITYKLISALGDNFVLNTLNGNLPQNPLVADQIKKEWNGIFIPGQGLNPDDPEVHIMNVAKILKGEPGVTLPSDPTQRAQQLPIIYHATKADESALMKGDKQPSTSNRYLNGYQTLTTIADEINPSTANLNDLTHAVGGIMTPASRSILGKMASNPDTREEATATILASRAAASKVLLAAEQLPNSYDVSVGPYTSVKGVWSAQYKNGKWVPYLDTNLVNKQLEANDPTSALGAFNQGVNKPQITIQRVQQAGVPKDLQQRVDVLNGATTHLLKTSDFDPNTKGISPRILADHYADPANNPLPVKNGGIPATSPDETLAKSLFEDRQLGDKLARDVVTNPDMSVTSHPVGEHYYGSVADHFAEQNGQGIPNFSKGFRQLIQEESGWNPNADAHKNFPNSHAYGLGQIQPGTMQMMGYNKEDRFDVMKNLDASSKYLASLIKKHGGKIAEAVREYGPTYNGGQFKRIMEAFGAG